MGTLLHFPESPRKPVPESDVAEVLDRAEEMKGSEPAKGALQAASGTEIRGDENTAEAEGSFAAGTPKPEKKRRRPAISWIKSAQAILLAVAICFSMGASSPTGRLQDLDHRLMCTCGCAQLLGECNHVGCTESTQELAELRSDIAGGMSDQQIFSAFVSKYGATVLAAPPAHGFDLIAWIAPFAVFAAALMGTILLIRRWGGLAGGWMGGKAQPADADMAKGDFAALDDAERKRRERIRRETDFGPADGGSSR